MALTKVTGHVVQPDTNIQFHNTKSTGIITATDTTQSTSTTTGALQIAGGVGIAKNLNVGGNANIAGVLTYEDVTNIESVGVATFKDDVYFNGTGAGISSSYWDKSANEFKFKDNVKLSFGDSQDLQIFHSGAHSFIKDTGTGMLKICADMLDFRNAADNATLAYAQEGNKFELFHNGNSRLETTADGITVQKGVTVSGIEGGDAQIRLNADEGDDDADRYRIVVGAGGTLSIQSYDSTFEDCITVTQNGAAKLYFNNSEKIATTNTGIDVTGGITATGEVTIPTWLVHAGDSNTKFGFEGPDTITFETAGDERLRITSTGLVQIGPTHNASTYGWDARLKVAVEQTGNDPSAIHFGESANGSANPAINFIRRDGSTVWSAYAGQISYDTGKFVFATSANAAPGSHSFGTKMVIKHDGKVGIGTDGPTYKLHVDGDDAAIGLWKSRRSSGSYIDYSVGANGAQLGFIGAGGQIIASGADAADFAIRSEGDLCFASGGGTERARINSSGKLGIGFKFNYTMNSNSTDLVIGDGGSGRGLTIWTAAGADNQTISFQTNETLNRAEGEISYGPTNTTTANDRNAMMFRVNSGERARITSNGYFGVGETPTTKVGVALAAQQADGTDDASDWGAGGIFQLDATGSNANNNEILLLGAHSGGVGQIASGIGFGRENTSNWGTYLSFKTHSTGTSNIDELNEKLRITSGGCVYSSNFGLGDDAHWKIRPNTSNTELAFEYATSSTLADTNIKAFFREGGSLCIKSDPQAAGGTMGDRGLIFQATQQVTHGQVIQGITFNPHHTAIGRARSGIAGLANNNGGSHPHAGGDLSFMTRYSADGHDLDVTADQRLRIDCNGDFMFNTPTLSGMNLWNMTGNDQRTRYQFWQKTGTYRGASFLEDRGDANGMDIIISKSRGGNGTGAVNPGDWLGRVMFTGADGTRQVNAGYIGMLATTNITVASDRVPSKMIFGTHRDVASGLTTQMTLTHRGRLGIGIGSPEAVLHPRANAEHGTDTAFMVGSDSGARYFKLNELSGQDNFGNCLMSFYDNSLREILTLQNAYAGLANMGMGIVFRGHSGGQTASIRAYNPSVNTTSGSVLHLCGENNNSGFQVSSSEVRVVGGIFQVANFQVRDGGFSGTWDTGISVNQSNAGACLIFMCCRNWDAGNSTHAGVYVVRCGYSGNNDPSVWHVQGNNSWTISRNTSNHTLQINGGSGNQRVCILWTT